MSKGVWPFKPRNVQRAIKTVQATGLTVRTVEIGPDGRIIVGCGEEANGGTGNADPKHNDNEVENWLSKHAR